MRGRKWAVALVAVGAIAVTSWAAAQTRPEPSPQAVPMDPAYRDRLVGMAKAAHARVERERARRIAPFDLLWGVQ